MLLPNPTIFQRVLNEANARVLDLPTNLQILIDPDKCPLNFLPFLAWASSVDYWDEHWSEDIKRNAIKNARYIHEKKGTKIAIKMLLEMVGFELANLTEWFDQAPEGRPGTFAITVAAPGGINPKTQALAIHMINIGKPVSRHLGGLILSINSKGNAYNAAHALSHKVISVYPYAPENQSVSGISFNAAHIYTVKIIETKEAKS